MAILSTRLKIHATVAKMKANPTLTRLARANLRIKTKTLAKALLQQAGLKQTLAPALLELVECINKDRAWAREKRILRNFARKNNYLPIVYNNTEFVFVALDFKLSHITSERDKTIHERLQALRLKACHAVVKRSVKQGLHDSTSYCFTKNFNDIGVKQEKFELWVQYGRKRYPKTRYNTLFTFPENWLKTVEKQGLAVVDGMVTMHAQQLESTNNIQVFSATWLVNGRGRNIESRHGFIALAEGLSYHSEKSPQNAINGLKRKIKKEKEVKFFAELSPTRFTQLVEKYGDIEVSLADAYAIGACESGVRSWCYKVGLDYDAGSATLAQVYDCYVRVPIVEARKTLIAVLRKANRSKFEEVTA